MVSLYHVVVMYFIDMYLITIYCISLHSNGEDQCSGNGGYGDSGGYGEPENGEDNAPSEHTHPGWNITYDSMKANLTVGSTEELIFVYNISSSQAYEYKLLEKDCSTEIEIEIGGNLITDN